MSMKLHPSYIQDIQSIGKDLSNLWLKTDVPMFYDSASSLQIDNPCSMEVINLSDIRFQDRPTITVMDENGNEIYVTQPILVEETYATTTTINTGAYLPIAGGTVYGKVWLNGPHNNQLLLGAKDSGGIINFNRGIDGNTVGAIGFSSPTDNNTFGVYSNGGGGSFTVSNNGTITKWDQSGAVSFGSTLSTVGAITEAGQLLSSKYVNQAVQYTNPTFLAAIDSSIIKTGTIDLARLPAMPSSNTIVCTTISAMTSGDQALVAKGTVVIESSTGNTYRYSGTGSVTLNASYIQQSDLTPDWSVITNRPTNVSTWSNDVGYLTNTTGDARYYTQSQTNSLYLKLNGGGTIYGGRVNLYKNSGIGIDRLTHGFGFGDAYSGIISCWGTEANAINALGNAGAGLADGPCLYGYRGVALGYSSAGTLNENLTVALRTDLLNVIMGGTLSTAGAITEAGTLLSNKYAAKVHTHLWADITDRPTNLSAFTNGPGYVSLGSALTGYAVGTNAALAATDTVLGAFGKVQAQLDTKFSNTVSSAANTFLAAPNGSAGVASFRTIVAADIPSLDWSKITTGKPTTLAGYGIAASDSLFASINAGTATKLQTARTIAGVSFDGSANIAIPYANLTGLPTLGSLAAKSTVTWTSDLTGVPSGLSQITNAVKNGNFRVGSTTYGNNWFGIEFSDPKSRALLINNNTGDTINMNCGIWSESEGWIFCFDKNKSLITGTVPWGSLTGVPSTFTPSAHSHAWSDITSGKPTTLSGYGISDALPLSAGSGYKLTNYLYLADNVGIQSTMAGGSDFWKIFGSGASDVGRFILNWGDNVDDCIVFRNTDWSGGDLDTAWADRRAWHFNVPISATSASFSGDVIVRGMRLSNYDAGTDYYGIWSTNVTQDINNWAFLIKQDNASTHMNARNSLELQIYNGTKRNTRLKIEDSTITASASFVGTTATFTGQINANDSANGILFNGNGKIWRDSALRINDPTRISLCIANSEKLAILGNQLYASYFVSAPEFHTSWGINGAYNYYGLAGGNTNTWATTGGFATNTTDTWIGATTSVNLWIGSKTNVMVANSTSVSFAVPVYTTEIHSTVEYVGTGLFAGTGDDATLTTYNQKLTSWYGTGIYDSCNNVCTGYIDHRLGKLYMKGDIVSEKDVHANTYCGTNTATTYGNFTQTNTSNINISKGTTYGILDVSTTTTVGRGSETMIKIGAAITLTCTNDGIYVKYISSSVACTIAFSGLSAYRGSNQAAVSSFTLPANACCIVWCDGTAFRYGLLY